MGGKVFGASGCDLLAVRELNRPSSPSLFHELDALLHTFVSGVLLPPSGAPAQRQRPGRFFAAV